MTDVTQGLSGIGDMAAKLQTGSATQSLDIGSLLGNMSMTTIIVSLVAGMVGTGYFMYGKKTCNFTMLFSGVALCVVPYFIGNTILLLVTCVAMAAAPFVIARYARHSECESALYFDHFGWFNPGRQFLPFNCAEKCLLKRISPQRKI